MRVSVKVVGLMKAALMIELSSELRRSKSRKNEAFFLASGPERLPPKLRA